MPIVPIIAAEVQAAGAGAGAGAGAAGGHGGGGGGGGGVVVPRVRVEPWAAQLAGPDRGAPAECSEHCAAARHGDEALGG